MFTAIVEWYGLKIMIGTIILCHLFYKKKYKKPSCYQITGFKPRLKGA